MILIFFNLFRLCLGTIANVTTFLVTATTENCALVLIMECANVENVFATQNGTVQVRVISKNKNSGFWLDIILFNCRLSSIIVLFQDIPPVNVELPMTLASLHTVNLLISYALVMVHANVASVNVMKLLKANILVNFVKTVR